jgi:predicted membrane-bound spermidine synthase
MALSNQLRSHRASRVADTAVPVQNLKQTIVVPVALLNTLAFIGGVTSVGIELSASRLIAPYFGDSTFIWANLIGLTLAFLSLGYWLGGRLADRYPSAVLLCTITAVAAMAAGFVPLMSRPILSASLRAFDDVAVGAFYGSLLGVLLMIAIPITLLGFVSPFVIRLRLLGITTAGQTAGNVYAISTIGSILGSFVPVVILIPWLGTRLTFLFLALLLFVPSLAGLLLLKRPRRALILALLLPLLIGAGTVSASARIRPPERGQLIYETESPYNYIQVVEDQGVTMLALNEGHAIHSVYDPDSLLTGGPWDYFMLGPLFNAPNENDGIPRVDSALLIGLAGGTAARELTAAYPSIEVVGVEIDAKIVEVGREYFELDQPNIDVVTADGRYYLKTTDQTFDLVGVDAYRQPYIPFHLTTRQFFQEISEHLTDDGVVVINVGRTETDYRLVDAIASTMNAVYPDVFAIEVDGYHNTILVGTQRPATLAQFSQSSSLLPNDSILHTMAGRAIERGEIRRIDPGGTVFTDDHAPVERVVDQIILDAALEGDDE